jgi:parallel beta helix pectate lyase-like protein
MATWFRSVVCCALAVLVPSGAAFAGVIRIVNEPGLGTFTSLQAAIDAAPDGSLLVLESGTYGNATIDGKTLSVLEMSGATAKLSGSLIIKNLGSAQWVLVSGLEVFGTTGPGATIASNTGHVRLQSCKITGGLVSGGSWADDGGPGVKVTSCPRVVLARCTLLGRDAQPYSGAPGAKGGSALETIDSAVALYDCSLTGGRGAEEGTPGGDGGDGCHILNWGVFASGCTISGGPGGPGDYIGCNVGGTGGDGIEIANAQVQLFDDTVNGGSGGWSSCGPAGPAGLQFRNTNSVVNILPGARRKATSAALVSDSASLPITFTGQPGDRIYVLRSNRPGYTFQSSLSGVWTIPTLLFWSAVPLTVLPAGGTATVSIPTAQIAAPHQLFFLQIYCVDAGGQAFLGSPLHVEQLDRQGGTDCNGNGVNDFVDLLEIPGHDCNHNLAWDACDIAGGLESDCNANGIPDTCDLSNHTSPDCNANSVPDECDIAAGTAQDCNGNGKPDSCDIATGYSYDVNGNGIPDECETHFPATFRVDAAAAPGGNGSVGAPFQTISEGIAAAFHGDTVLVKDGLYVGAANRNLSPMGRDIVIKSENGPLNCIVDCQLGGRGFLINDGEGSTCRIEGFTIRNGKALNAPTATSQGGGIHIYQADPVIRNCIIEDCEGRMGGGIYASSTSMQVRDCILRRCSAPTINGSSGTGGGMDLSWTDAGALGSQIVNTEFSQCSSVSGGGLYFGSGRTLRLSHCRFFNNSAQISGGALVAASYSNYRLEMDNCVMAANTAAKGGAVFASSLNNYAAPTAWSFTSCTFAHNTASTGGGVVYLNATGLGAPPFELHDSILWGNLAPSGSAFFHTGGAAEIRVFSSDIDGGMSAFSLGASATLVWGPNLAADPLFLDPDGPDNSLATGGDNDYRLNLGSPCIDAADNTLVPADSADIDGDGDVLEPVPWDLAHLPRFVEIPSAPNTGIGTPPLTDMGTFERQP